MLTRRIFPVAATTLILLAAVAPAMASRHARAAAATTGAAQNAGPRLLQQEGHRRLVVHARPFLILGGELGNSSAGTAAQADAILPLMDGGRSSGASTEIRAIRAASC